MNVGIMCGSYETASMESRLNNSKIANLVAMKDYCFVMESGETGSMRDVKEILKENGKFLIVVGREDELDEVNADVNVPVHSTFERLEAIYKNCDVILCLTGGVGTESEFISFLNNKIETKDDKPLIIYNEDGSYNYSLKALELKRKEGLVDSSYKLYFDEARNIEELAEYLEKAENKINKSTEERSRVR